MADRLSPYATPSATRAVLERHGLFTKYALGQNFLVNDDVIRKIIELADVRAADHVLEVGPGIGTLTYALAQHAGHVTAIEKDADLPAVLADTLADVRDRFTLLSLDALDATSDQLAIDGPASKANTDLCTPPPALPNKLVSNLPYAVAATVVLQYLQAFSFLQSTTVMVQREVADRMTASVGTKAYGAYTVKLSLYAQPAGRFQVAAGNFFPPPHVESTVLRLDRCIAQGPDGAQLTPAQLEATCTMADAAFANRRKTLANSCKSYFASNPEIVQQLPHIFETAGVDPRRRGETLSRDEFIHLGLALA